MKVSLLGLLVSLAAASSLVNDCSSKPTSSSYSATLSSGSSTSKAASSRTTSASPTYETCPYAYPNNNAFTNADFAHGLRGWTAASSSKNPKAITAYNGSAIMSFPKGKVVTSSLSQTIQACNGYVEGLYFEYNLTKGGGCLLTTTIPPFGQFYKASLQKAGDDNVVSKDTTNWGPGPSNAAQHLLFNVTVKCNGTQASTVALHGFSLYGIG